MKRGLSRARSSGEAGIRWAYMERRQCMNTNLKLTSLFWKRGSINNETVAAR